MMKRQLFFVAILILSVFIWLAPSLLAEEKQLNVHIYLPIVTTTSGGGTIPTP